jgi:hypothetical protein
MKMSRFFLGSFLLLSIVASCARGQDKAGAASPVYIKVECEDMAGVASYRSNDPKDAWKPRMAWFPQWSRGGDSGWWAAYGEAAAASGEIASDIVIPSDGAYTLWVRYEDYAGKAEPFDVKIEGAGAPVAAQFGRADVAPAPTPPNTWSYTWQKTPANLKKGPAKLKISLAGAAPARRGLDAVVITNDAGWTPVDRAFPPQAYAKYLLKWAQTRTPLKPIVPADAVGRTAPAAWALPKVGDRDFWYTGGSSVEPGASMPVYINVSDNDATKKAYIAKFGGAGANAPVFGSPALAIQIPIGKVGDLLDAANPTRQYILNNKRPFVLVGNYSSAGQKAGSYNAVKSTFGDLWIGIISGENSYIGMPFTLEGSMPGPNFKQQNYDYFFNQAKAQWSKAMSADWATPIENPYEKFITGMSVGTVPHIHQLGEIGAKTVGAESAAALPYIQWQMSFARGAARQYGIKWFWYYGASFGDAIRTFVTEGPYILELEGLKIDNRNATIGPSIPHIRRTLLNTYFQGATVMHPEQGYNLFAPTGDLNPMGWPYDEMLRLATKHPDRGVIYTPVAVLLDKSHGWDKYTYGGMRIYDSAPLQRADHMLDQFFNIAYFPFPKNEGEPVDDLNVPWPNGYFGDIFDVLVTSPTKLDAVKDYPVVFCVGDTKLDAKWAARLKQYVNDGGTLVINAEQVVDGMEASFLGANLNKGATKEASTVQCSDGETLVSSPFPYATATPTTAEVIAKTPSGDVIALVNKVGKGRVVLTTPSYLLGHDQIATPYMAHLLLQVTSGLSPVDIRGNCEHYVNLRPDGYVVMVSNNEGIRKLSHSAAVMDPNHTADVTLRIKEKPLATEDWIGEDPRPTWVLPNEWLAEYTQPMKLEWKAEGGENVATVKLRPGEMRVFFIKTK